METWILDRSFACRLGTRPDVPDTGHIRSEATTCLCPNSPPGSRWAMVLSLGRSYAAFGLPALCMSPSRARDSRLLHAWFQMLARNYWSPITPHRGLSLTGIRVDTWLY